MNTMSEKTPPLPKSRSGGLALVSENRDVIVPPLPVKRLDGDFKHQASVIRLPLRSVNPNFIIEPTSALSTSANSEIKLITNHAVSLKANDSLTTRSSHHIQPSPPPRTKIIIIRQNQQNQQVPPVAANKRTCQLIDPPIPIRRTCFEVKNHTLGTRLPLQAINANVNNKTSTISSHQQCSPEVNEFYENIKNIDSSNNVEFSSCKNLNAKPKKTKLSLGCSSQPAATGKGNSELLLRTENYVTEKVSTDTPLTGTTIPTPHDDSANFFKEILTEMLPSDYEYKIEEVGPMLPYHQQEDFDQTEMLTATIRVNIRNKEDALQWLEKFKTSSSTDWRVRRTFPENTKCLIFKKGFRCTHNTMAQYNKKEGIPYVKHTECKAYLSIAVKNFNMKWSIDKLLKEFPCEINLHHCHNHPIKAADAIRHQRPNEETRALFLDMYKKGHSPSSALSTRQYDLQTQNPDNWFEILADGALCPNLQWCYYLYRSEFEKNYGPATGPGMVESLTSAIEKYNEECGSACAVATTFEETDLIVYICSPLMKRVHQHLKASGEINFMDAGGSMDRHNSRVFVLLAPSVAGALPLGLIISSSESEVVVKEGLKMLKTILPSNAFYGRGADKGPRVVMTDDSKSERNALQYSFPGIILLLCLFHTLQAFWRYVWDSNHKVKAEDKEEIFFIFKSCCNAETPEEFIKLYKEMLNSPLISNNTHLVKHLNDLYARAPEWALCYRKELLTRGNNTNNYSETTILRFKKDLLQRVRAYSVVQLFDFLTARLDAYFERRLAAVVNNRRENYWTSKHYIKPSKLVPLECAKSSHDNIYIVKNAEKGTSYMVDMQLEICSCPVGKNGAPCKHQFAVAKIFNLSSSQFLPAGDEEAIATLHRIMSIIPARAGWYAPLQGGPTTAPYETELTCSSFGDTASPTDTDCPTDLQYGISSAESEETKERAMDLWQSINEYISNGLQERPDVFAGAVEKFGLQFMKAKELSENCILSAMHTFNINSFGAKAVKTGRYVKVNSAAIIRRKYAKMAGRKVTQQGRPPKSAFTSEHGYPVTKRVLPAWNRCSNPRKAIPHSISQKVQMQSRNKKR